ncbi:DUF3800 domain-containing protein [Actinomycetospora lemnae]|uniref:DUF3800 domain-containing protein n=1 Tax=Actinomycetospora lemnae TaxID=3019891 RepID=A0ABT5STJ2_9PSEU|nr:DUF3800 domain-containing protein [Actinomycetospora sp. DW7H6]MDD7966172.1 DUF3800 domain-containing protein [Actinomycetospora sp. DW7H6]
MVLIAYVDETGDTGDVAKSGSSSCYGLGCLLMELDSWGASFESTLELRRRLKQSHGLPFRTEVKANYLIRGGGPIRALNLAPNHRSIIYRAHLRHVAQLRARAFAVVVDKRSARMQSDGFFFTAWQALMNRLERTSTKERQPILIVHDEGEDFAVRREVRKARRFLTAGKAYGGGYFIQPLKWIVEDPVPRNSQHSYYIQIADMIAYAGWRTYMAPSKGVAQVVPQSMWQELGPGIHAKVNMFSGGTPGVVVRK